MKAISIAMIFLLPVLALGQSSNIPESNRKGLEIIRKSLAAYGGTAITDSLKLAFKMRVEKNILRGQSLVSKAPFEPYFAYYDFMLDRPRGLEIEKRKSTIAGFIFENDMYYRQGKGININPVLKQYFEMNGNSIAVTMTFLPHNALVNAFRAPLSVRYVSDQVVGGRAVYLVTFSAGPNMDNIYIDKQTNYILKQERLFTGNTGEELNEFFFRNHRKLGKISIPEETIVVVHNSVYGTITNTYAFSDLTTDFTIDTATMKVPAGYKVQDYSYRKKFEARQLAKDIYLLENISNSNFQWSYNVLFAVMDEYVLVAEAPLTSDMTERVIAKIKEIAPGKPVKYLVQSHHHDDHLGGIRGYIAEGTAIITTEHNTELISKMAAVRLNAAPDRLSLHPKTPVMETVKNKKYVIKDRNHEVVIYDIGPNPHANEMLIVYFPNEKLIYESDLVNKGEYPLTAPGHDFFKKIKVLGLQVEKIASLHGQVVEKEEVQQLMK